MLLHADLSSVVSDKVAAMTGGRSAAPSAAEGKAAPRHLAEGVLQGGLGLGKGLLGGITGLVAAPLSGAREGAAEGKVPVAYTVRVPCTCTRCMHTLSACTMHLTRRVYPTTPAALPPGTCAHATGMHRL